MQRCPGAHVRKHGQPRCIVTHPLAHTIDAVIDNALGRPTWSPLARYRHQLWLLTERDLRVRYSTSALGYLWSILDPLVMAGIYWFVFTQVFHRGIANEPYIVFMLSALLPWMWFNGAVSDSTRAYIYEAKLIRSTKIPRTIWVVRLVLARVAMLVGMGVIIGAGVSLWASRFVTSVLYGLEGRDPATLVSAAITLAAVGAVAGGLPAWRAARIDPAEVLRES